MAELFGTVQRSFFRSPAWADQTKPAGANTLKDSPFAKPGWWLGYPTTAFFWCSPNLGWFFITLLVYTLCPYDLKAARVWAYDWILYRFLVNSFVMFSYVGFWHISLYWLGRGKRKFSPESKPTGERMVHNIYYSVLGIFVQTIYEAIFMNLWATGKLPYIPDSAFWSEIPRMCLWVLGVPFFRDFHFYFVHRFLHYRPFYKYIHSLHHRNTDIEPFSGLCMHPIEHLYYLGAMALSLYFYMSPLHLMWSGLHLILSPAASHSGWEDNWQSDLYHYIHHATYECNYGTNGIPWDKWFGTFHDALAQPPPSQSPLKSYAPAFTSNWSRGFFPSVYNVMYFVFSGALLLILAVNLVHPGYFGIGASGIAFLVALGPLVVAVLFWRLSGDTLPLLNPFHKESLPVAFLHVTLSVLLCLVPIYHLVLSAVSERSIYCHLWNC